MIDSLTSDIVASDTMLRAEEGCYAYIYQTRKDIDDMKAIPVICRMIGDDSDAFAREEAMIFLDTVETGEDSLI